MKKHSKAYWKGYSKGLADGTEAMILSSNFKKNPRCWICGKDLVEAIDSITKTKTGYIWKFNCKCVPANIRMCIG